MVFSESVAGAAGCVHTGCSHRTVTMAGFCLQVFAYIHCFKFLSLVIKLVLFFLRFGCRLSCVDSDCGHFGDSLVLRDALR
jgi:hypothetical protein